MAPRDAYFAHSRSIELELAEGEIAAELVTPYPPGIPVLAPGEVITREKIDFLIESARQGRGNYGASGAAPLMIDIVIR